jgi:hypothetical protein
VLQPWLVQVQVHPVDCLDLEQHVASQHLSGRTGSVITSSSQTTRPTRATNRDTRSTSGHIVTPFHRRPELFRPPQPVTGMPSSGWGEAPVRGWLTACASGWLRHPAAPRTEFGRASGLRRHLPTIATACGKVPTVIGVPAVWVARLTGVRVPGLGP